MVRHHDPDLHAGAQTAARDEIPTCESMPRPPRRAAGVWIARTPSASRLRPRGSCRPHWYRPDGRYDKPPVIVLRFNQPVKPEDVAAHVSAAFRSIHSRRPAFSGRWHARLGNRSSQLQAFEAKLAAARTAASATSSVLSASPPTGTRSSFRRARDMVVLEATSAVPPDSSLRVTR